MIHRTSCRSRTKDRLHSVFVCVHVQPVLDFSGLCKGALAIHCTRFFLVEHLHASITEKSRHACVVLGPVHMIDKKSKAICLGVSECVCVFLRRDFFVHLLRHVFFVWVQCICVLVFLRSHDGCSVVVCL